MITIASSPGLKGVGQYVVLSLPCCLTQKETGDRMIGHRSRFRWQVAAPGGRWQEFCPLVSVIDSVICHRFSPQFSITMS